MNLAAVIAYRIGLAFGVLILAHIAMTFPKNVNAFQAYMQARTELRLEKPGDALASMQRATELDPFNPDYRRNHIVAVTQLAVKGDVRSIEDAARAFAISVSASGYDQNTLTVWLMWLTVAGHGNSEAYRSARERLLAVNPNLAEPYEADVVNSANRNDLESARVAALKFRDTAKTDSMKSRATEMLKAIDDATRS